MNHKTFVPVTAIGNQFFSNKDLTSVTIPNSVISIGSGAFTINSLTIITISNSVTIIDDYAFDDWNGRFRGGSFQSYYNRNGKKAGTYTRPDARSKKWTYR